MHKISAFNSNCELEIFFVSDDDYCDTVEDLLDKGYCLWKDEWVEEV